MINFSLTPKQKQHFWYSSIASILLALIFVLIIKSSSNYFIRQAEASMKRTSTDYSMFFDQEITSTMLFVQILGNSLTPNFISNDYSNLSNIFSQTNASANMISSLYFIYNNSGVGVNSTGKIDLVDMPMDLRERNWYINATNSNIAILSDSYKHLDTDKTCITISYAIKNNGNVIGVLSADIFTDSLNNYYSNILSTEIYDVYVLSSNNSILINKNKDFISKPFNEILSAESAIYDLPLKNLQEDQTATFLQYINMNNEKKFGYYSTSSFSWKILCVSDYKTIILSNSREFILIVLFSIFICIITIGVINFNIDKSHKFDAYTGLYTMNELISFLKKKSLTSKSYTTLFINIMNLETLRNFLNSEFEENILLEYTTIMKSIFSKECRIVKGRNDTFILYFYHPYKKNIRLLIEKGISELSNTTFKINNESIKLTSSFTTITFTSEEINDIKNILPTCEEIINKQKFTPNNLIQLTYTDLTKEENKNKKNLLIIQEALKNKSIIPFYQPIMDIQTNKIAKYEVLMRINKDGEYLAPYPFIVLAEKYNLIEEIDLCVLEKALRYKNTIDLEDKLVFSFNISGKALNDDTYLRKATKLVDKYSINHKNIEFEITETENISNLDILRKNICKYKDKSYKFSIDDFGIAYSSISYLKNIPADYLKIDGSFIKDINEKEENLYLVKAIVAMAKGYKKKTIAEFVESEDILITLKEIGVDYVQGYFIDKPKEKIQ
jgi:EAL domain-containing protein (putative c-di-GMP-specific phosphodiesterase class I)/GGDEF domain-containing protein